jgi:hypothetical protein
MAIQIDLINSTEVYNFPHVIDKLQALRGGRNMPNEILLSSKCFQVSKERYVFKEQSRIRLATIYIHYITHTHLDLIV